MIGKRSRSNSTKLYVYNKLKLNTSNKSKDRLTCAFFINASGGKEKPIIISKSANPRCFRGIQDRTLLPCQFFNQPKAWMNSDILMEILSKLIRRLSRENRSIILFMDNAPCRPEDLDEKFEKIKIVAVLIHQFASNFQTTGRTRSFEK